MRRTRLHATALLAAVVLSATACSGDDREPASEGGASAGGATAAGRAAVTEPGTALEFGDPATLVWQPTTSLTGTLDLSVDAVVEQRPSVLDGWARDDAMAAARPYFVAVSLANAGETDLGGLDVPLYLRDDTGALGAPWTLGGDFAACQSGPIPTPFAPGAETEMCLVYLVPEGARIDDMVFEPTEGYDPIVWTGDVTTPGKPATKERGTG